MERNRKPRYRMDFGCPQLTASTALMGLAFFLRAVYYFGFVGLQNLGVMTMILHIILPMTLEIAFVLLLRGIRLNAPGVYGIICGLYCVVLVIMTFGYGNVLRTILGVIWYVVCGAAIVTTMGGILRSRILTATAFFLAVGVRFLCFDLGSYILDFHPVAFLPEAAGLCVLGAMAFLALGITDRRK